MPAIFSNNAGIMSAVITPSIPSIITIDGFQPAIPAAITSIGCSGQGAYQWMQSLRDAIYVYVFGERVGDLVIGGFTAGRDCNADNTTGLDEIVTFYNSNRLSAKGKPVAITLGVNTALSGFLIGFQVIAQDANTGLVQFSLVFKYPPITAP